jgi:hypothetical protein
VCRADTAEQVSTTAGDERVDPELEAATARLRASTAPFTTNAAPERTPLDRR